MRVKSSQGPKREIVRYCETRLIFASVAYESSRQLHRRFSSGMAARNAGC